MSKPDTRETEGHVPDTEAGMVLQEIRRLGRAIDQLAEKLDQKHDQLEERLRAAEVELAKVTTKISVAAAFAAAAGAGVVEFVRAVSH